MENIGQKKKPCEEKENFAPKMLAENVKVQDTTKSVIQKDAE